MTPLVTTITIAAAPSHVWKILADVERWPAWTASVTSAARVDDVPLGVGAGVRIVQPRLRPAVWTITDWMPPQRFTWVSRSPGVTVTATHVLEPTPEGGCVVTLALRYDGILGALIGRLARKLTESYMTMEANGLKHRCESGAT
jgi:hypothetical protein